MVPAQGAPDFCLRQRPPALAGGEVVDDTFGLVGGAPVVVDVDKPVRGGGEFGRCHVPIAPAEPGRAAGRRRPVFQGAEQLLVFV